MTYSASEKLAAATREVAMRRRVYPRWIAHGRMTSDKADREIALMEAIAADYRGWADKERLDAEAAAAQTRLL